MLSVVVPVYNVAPYLDECLTSVLGQQLREIEVIAVDDGSTDGSAEILARRAQQDARLKVVRQENAGQGAARNLGVSLARGTFLTFLDADDTLPPGAYQHAVQTLRRTGSDFAVGEVKRVRNDTQSPPPWAAVVHERDRLGVTIDDFPEALQDVIACNRVLRRQFWVDEVGGFEGRGAYEDHVPMVKAYVRARQFDVLKRVTYYWRIRENRTSTGQQKHQLENLRDRVAVKAEAQDLLEREASEQVFSTWLGRVLDLDLPPYVKHALVADDEYRELLSEAYLRHVAMATPHAWRSVRVFHKLRAWHAATHRWDVVDLIQQEVRNHGRPPRCVVRDGRVFADLEIAEELDPDTPPELFELADSETALDARLLRARWDDTTRLRLRGWASVRAVGAGGRDHHLTLSLRRLDGDETLTLTPSSVDEPRANSTIAEAEADHAPAGFEVVVDVESLLRVTGTPAGRWALEADVSVDGVRRAGAFSGPVAGGSAAAQSLSSTRTQGHLVTPVWQADGGFVLDVAPVHDAEPAEPETTDRPEIHHAGTVDDALVLELTGLPDGASLELVGDRVVVPLGRPTSGPRGHEVVLPLRASILGGPVLPLPTGGYSLRLADGTPVSAALSFRSQFPLEQTTGDVTARWTFTRRGEARLTVMSGPRPAERSKWARRQVVHRYERSEDGAVDQVLFHSRGGLAAGGAPAAVARAVAARRPDLDLVWSTTDRSVAVPDGARRVVVGTQEWAQAVRRSRFVVADGPVDGLLPPADRRWMNLAFVQTLTSAGHARWQADGFSPAHVREQEQRLARWDVLVAGGSRAAEVIATDLGYSGEVAVLGDPASDLVVSADDEARRRVRARLGLGSDAFVVLYAPADRPDRATGASSARLTRLLDVRELRAALGPSSVILVRGGAAVAHGERRILGEPGVIDVTDYPEEADLVVAADAAVLDYTSLRLTWALTGKPAVLHVPDLDTYAAHHPQVVPWEDSAIGPTVTTTKEAARALGDPVGLASAYADAVARVNATYNELADGGAAARVAARLLDER